MRKGFGVRMNKERWKDVVGFEGRYQVSNKGRIRSVRIVTNCPNSNLPPIVKMLRPNVNKKNGYMSIGVFKDGKYIRCYVHRLVLEAFVGPCPDGMEARHFPDQNKLNNNLSNLQWGTKSQNRGRDREIDGTANIGERHGMSKLKECQVIEILKLWSTGKWTRAKLARKFKMNWQSIDYIVKGKLWKHLHKGPLVV